MPLVENLIGEQDDMAADEACANCYFYKAAKSRKHGFCQQQPPQFTHIDPESGFPRFFHPVVSPHAWCGQWEGVEEDVKG